MKTAMLNIADNGMIVGVSYIGKSVEHFKRENSSWSRATGYYISLETAEKIISNYNFKRA